MSSDSLIIELAKKAGLDKEKASLLVAKFEETITGAVQSGQKVVYSNFGTFYLVHYPSKVIIHPKKRDQKMVMLPTNVIKWMPAANVKDLVNLEIEVENSTAHGTRKKTLGLPQAPKTEPVNNTASQEAFNSNESNAEVEHIIPIKFSTTVGHQDTEPQNIAQKPEPTTDGKTSIYEELMNDGTKVESTFGDTIRVHRDRTNSFFSKVFNRNKPPTENIPVNVATPSEKVSLSGSGIFDISKTDKPSVHQSVNPVQSTPKIQETPPLQSMTVATQNPDVPPLQPKSEPVKEEIELTPFATTPKEKVSYIDLSKIVVTKDVLALLPEKISRRYKSVPVSVEGGQLTVAMVDPQDIEAKEIIKKITQKPIIARIASEEDINHILDQYSSGLESELSQAIQEGKEENETETGDKSNLIESTSDNAPAARIVTSLLRRAIRDKASDVHIEPGEKEITVRFRIDGVLQKSASLPKDVQDAVASRIKIMSNLKIDEQRLPQDGRFSLNFEDRKIDFRVSTLPIANGEKIVMRVLDKATGILTVVQLGMRGNSLESLKEILKKPHGMILVTGPTGSGKTTTLYALIDQLYSEGVNIVTLEDPIEYQMPGINQSQVNSQIEYSFASGLRSIVRQDPDIIMIGEIRDGETAEMAVHAALTGHVVLSTLHTNDSAGATPRLIDMGVEPFLLTSSINAVIGQRLGRKICADCKEEIILPPEEIAKIKAEIEKMTENEKSQIKNKEMKFYHGKGCKSCNNSGYKGRVGLFELLVISDPIKELILTKGSSSKIAEKAIAEGMVTMLHDGILKALDGITTLEEVWRITEE